LRLVLPVLRLVQLHLEFVDLDLGLVLALDRSEFEFVLEWLKMLHLLVHLTLLERR
jgi:hypothetical protein